MIQDLIPQGWEITLNNGRAGKKRPQWHAPVDSVPVAPAPIVVPVPPQVAAVALWDDLTAATALLNANGHSVVETPAAKDPAAMLASALELVRAAGYRVTKAKARVKDRVGPTFVATFADGAVTRMSTFTSLSKFDVGRGIRLSQAAWQSRAKRVPACYRTLRDNPFMSRHSERIEKLGQARLERLAAACFAPPPVKHAHFEQDGAVLASFTAEQLAA